MRSKILFVFSTLFLNVPLFAGVITCSARGARFMGEKVTYVTRHPKRSVHCVKRAYDSRHVQRSGHVVKTIVW